MQRQRLRGIPRRAGIQHDFLANEVEAAVHIQRPALSLRGQQIPTMHILDLHLAHDPDGVRRTAQVQFGRNGAVHASGLALEQSAEFAQPGAIELQIEINPFRRRKPVALERECAQPLRRAVCARRLGVKRNLPASAASSRREDVEIGLHQVEDRLGIADFEIDAAVAHVNGRRGAHRRAIHNLLEIPVARFRLHQIDVRACQPDGIDHEAAPPAMTRCWGAR